MRGVVRQATRAPGPAANRSASWLVDRSHDTRSTGWRQAVDSSAPRAATICPTTVGSRAAADGQPIRSRHSNALLTKSSECQVSASARDRGGEQGFGGVSQGEAGCNRREQGALGPAFRPLRGASRHTSRLQPSIKPSHSPSCCAGYASEHSTLLRRLSFLVSHSAVISPIFRGTAVHKVIAAACRDQHDRYISCRRFPLRKIV